MIDATTYQPTVDALAAFVPEQQIREVFEGVSAVDSLEIKADAKGVDVQARLRVDNGPGRTGLRYVRSKADGTLTVTDGIQLVEAAA